MSSIVIEKRERSWLQKQAWFWVAKCTEILRFYRKTVVLISALPPPAPLSENRWRSERAVRSRDIREIGVCPAPAPTPSATTPHLATGLFNFVHKSVMEDLLQALPFGMNRAA